MDRLKKPGRLRTVQNWIGHTGCTIEEADFIPPKPEEVPSLLENLFDYMNDRFIDPVFINIAISHFQFETIMHIEMVMVDLVERLYLSVIGLD